MKKSNRGGWHSDLGLLNWLDIKTTNHLITKIKNGIEEMLVFFNPDFNIKQHELSKLAWANVSEYGHYNSLHTHPDAIWSGVYYVDDGGDPTSKIVFPDPRVAASMIQNNLNPFSGSDFELTPHSGLLAVFPSWLQHSVKPYQGNKRGF